MEFLLNLNVKTPPCTNVKPPHTNVKPPIDDFLATVLGLSQGGNLAEGGPLANTQKIVEKQ